MDTNTPIPIQSPPPAFLVNNPIEPARKLPIIWIIFIGLFIITIFILGIYYFMQNSKEELGPGPSPQISSTPSPIMCKDPVCLMPQFLACAPSELTMPFVEGNYFVIKVFGKVNGLCHYSLTVLDKNGNTPLNSSDCQVPLEKITKNTFGHFFGEDKNPGQEATKAEQDKLENDYCAKKTAVLSPAATPSAKVVTSSKITCSENDQGCIFTNVIDNFTNSCKPAEVIVSSASGSSTLVTFAISGGQNNACRFQMNGFGVNQDCLFAKENVTGEVVKGMLGMDNIPDRLEFQKIKAISCK